MSLSGKIARLRNNQGHLGTAWMIDPKFALTACHCVRMGDGTFWDNLTLLFFGIDTPVQVKVKEAIPELDTALLEVIDTSVDLSNRVIYLSHRACQKNDKVYVIGHPLAELDRNPRGFTLRATVIEPQASRTFGDAVCEETIHMAYASVTPGASGSSNLHGMSGSPIFLEDTANGDIAVGLFPEESMHGSNFYGLPISTLSDHPRLAIVQDAWRSSPDKDYTSYKLSDEIAIKEGLCEEVDFLTPIEEPHFYLGVDVQPGHLAAGLVVERPAARQQALNALEARRNVLIVGPSGSGKSALMWEVARAASYVETWFRIRRLTVEKLPYLMALIKACRASAKAPVGFVLDDIGSGLTEGWDALARTAASHPGILLLGSAREEDFFLLFEQERAHVVREVGDDELAERLWKELRSRSQTQAPGWREPWRESRGLLLEYTYLLTQGNRLTDVLRTQVADRARDSSRAVELAVLRVVAAAGATGAMVNVDRMPAVLNIPEEEIARALRRLIAEHLILETSDCRIGALHQLRAVELFRLCHEYPPPTPNQTIERTLLCLTAEDLETFIVRICEINAAFQEPMVEVIAARLNQKPDPVLAASALRGLGKAHMSASVNAWLKQPEVQALPKTQITTAAMFGLPGVGFPDILQFAHDVESVHSAIRTSGRNDPSLQLNECMVSESPVKFFDQIASASELGVGLPTFRTWGHVAAASRSFCSVIENSAKNDPRKKLTQNLMPEIPFTLFRQSTSLGELNELISSLIGTEISNTLRDQIRTLQPDLTTSRVEDVAELLGTVGLIDQGIVQFWVETTGQQYLLDRIYNEVPWVSRPEFRNEEEGLAICADIRCVAASRQSDPHADVVHLCELLLAVAPRADLAISNAVAPDGNVVIYGDYELATKRIPRKNLPPTALPEWNRRWLKAVADRVAAPSYTDYLNRATALLRDLLAALESVLDEWFRKGKVSETKCERLNHINDQAATLTPPRLSSQAVSVKRSTDPNGSVTKLQSVLFDCSGNVITRFNKLPEDANSYILWTRDILNRIDAATEIEPWDLLPKGQPTELQRLRQIVEGLHLMAGESSCRNLNPIQIWHKPKAQRKTAFRLASIEAHNAIRHQLAKTKAEIQKTLDTIQLSTKLYIRLNGNESIPWPPAEVLITISTVDIFDWTSVVSEENAEILRAAVGVGRKMILVPLVNGIAVSRLAIGGMNNLFPVEDEALAWLNKEGIAILDDIRVRLFITVTDQLTEISGIKKFDYGGKDRPLLEQEALTSAYANLNNSLCHLRALLASDPEILTQIEEFVEEASSGEIFFAAEIMSSLHGEIKPAFVEMFTIQNELLRLDIAEALGK